MIADVSADTSKAVGIVGMHRSGTSMVSRVINLLGAYLGTAEELFGPRYDNPEGFWERKDIVAFHDDLLDSFSQRWDTFLPLKDDWLSHDKIANYQYRLNKIIDTAFSGKKIWAWKDPRTCLFLPLWQKLLSERGVPLSVVYVVRNPVDVAKSLAKRNGFSFEKSYALWLNYNLSALSVLQEVPLVFVSYECFLSSPLQQLERLTKYLPVPFSTEEIKYSDNFTSFLRKDLHHNQSTSEDFNRVPKRVKKLYRLLISGAEDRMLANSSFFEKVVVMNSQLRGDTEFLRWDMERYFRNECHVIPCLKLENEKVSQSLSALRQELSERESQVSDLSTRLESSEEVLAEKREEIEGLNSQIEMIVKSNSWKVTRPLRGLRRTLKFKCKK